MSRSMEVELRSDSREYFSRSKKKMLYEYEVIEVKLMVARRKDWRVVSFLKESVKSMRDREVEVSERD